jgi:quercetin dioxygenase-like cupin family protein
MTLRPETGETITDRPGLRVTLLVDTPELAITESVYGPGRRGPEPHLHHDHVDAFVVLEGELSFTVRGGVLRAAAGTFVLVPRNVAHGFRNTSESSSRFLNLHAPSCGFGDYLRGRNPQFDQHPCSLDEGLDPDAIAVLALDRPEDAAAMLAAP